MKLATVIQGSLRFLGGGELVCVNTCQALQKLGYRVRLVSDRFRPGEVEAAFGMGEVVEKCEHVQLPGFAVRLSRFSSLSGLFFARRLRRLLEEQNGDVIFVTRDPPRPYVLPGAPLFRFMYEIGQLRHFWENYRSWVRSSWQARYGRDYSRTTFLALSSQLVTELKQNGYHRAKLIYPSYGIPFRPRPKKNQVVYVTFLAPQKKLDDFMAIARLLPQYKFYLVGRDTERMNRIYQGYARRVLGDKPDNVDFVKARIRQAPGFLEESRVYLHTSTEQGMGIAVMEALSAGCIPVAPRLGGAGEVLEAAGVGFRYDRIEEAADFIKSEMDQDQKGTNGDAGKVSPEEIAERARIFSPEAFKNRLREIIEDRDSRV